MRDIDIPPEFPQMGAWFDLALDFMVEEDGHKDDIDFALSQIDGREKQIVRAFLIHVLATVHEPRELQQVWRAAKSRTLIPDDRQLRAFLQEIVNRIG